MQDREKELAEWVRLKECPGCGYSLEGLGAEGTCPECGRGYDGAVVVLAGEGRGNFERDVEKGGKGMIWQGVSFLIFMWLMTQGPWRTANLNVVGYMVLGALGLAVALYGRLFSASEPRMQVWLTREGVWQGVSTVEGRRAVWVRRRLGLLFAPVFIVMVSPPVQRWGWGFGVIVGIFVGVLAMVEAWRWRESWWVWIGGEGERPMWDWAEVDAVRVEEAKGGRVRLRCRGLTRWGWVVVSRGWVIDIEVACPRELAEGFGGMVRGWWMVRQQR